MNKSTDVQEELENKKRKALDKAESSKSHISRYFPPRQKIKSPSALKKSTCTSTQTSEKPIDSDNPVCTGMIVTYLHFMVDTPPDKDCIGQWRMILGRLLASMQTADPNAVIAPYEPTLEWLEGLIQRSRSSCIHHLAKMPRSITQLHKYFPRGKPKWGGGTVFTIFLILHTEVIEDVILDVKDGMQSCDAKISKQRVQNHDAVKLGCIMCLATKADITRWTEFFMEKIEKALKEKLLLAFQFQKLIMELILKKFWKHNNCASH